MVGSPEFRSGSSQEAMLEAPAGDVAELISANTAASFARFGRYEKETLLRLRAIYEEGWGRLDKVILLRGMRRRAGAPLSADETIRLTTLKREVETAMREMEERLREFAPDAIRGSGTLGEEAGAAEIGVLTREIPRIGFPRFAIINREAIEFYANYALETTINYGEEALNAIKRRLDLAMITGEAWAPVSRDVRRIILEKRGMAITGLHHKADRIVRTELVRAYAGGHTAYGEACDFVVGERHNVQAGACEECLDLAGKEYLFREGERFEIVHPHCHCYPTYIFSKNLFTKEELARLEV